MGIQCPHTSAPQRDEQHICARLDAPERGDRGPPVQRPSTHEFGVLRAEGDELVALRHNRGDYVRSVGFALAGFSS